MVTNTPRTAKVLVSNLTRIRFFFSKGNAPVHKKFGLFWSACVLSAELPYLTIVYFSWKQFSLQLFFNHFKNPAKSKFAFHIGCNFTNSIS